VNLFDPALAERADTPQGWRPSLWYNNGRSGTWFYESFSGVIESGLKARTELEILQ